MDPRSLKHELTDCIIMTIFGVLAGHYDAENISYFLKLNEEYFIKEYFDYSLNTPLERKNIISYTITNKDHGRTSRREHYLIYDIDWLYGKEDWKNISMIGMTRNYREINDEVYVQKKYYISDLKLSGKEFSSVVRGHWSIENNLHGILDVHFREDWNLCKEKNAMKKLGHNS